MKRIERLEPLRGHFAELQNDFAMHRANIKADITGSVRAAVSEQIGPMKETVEEARGILLEQEARAKVMAEHRAETERQRAEAERQRSDEAKEKEARRKSRTAMLVGVSPIIVALIAAWSAWVAMRAPQPQQPPQQHIEAK